MPMQQLPSRRGTASPPPLLLFVVLEQALPLLCAYAQAARLLPAAPPPLAGPGQRDSTGPPVCATQGPTASARREGPALAARPCSTLSQPSAPPGAGLGPAPPAPAAVPLARQVRSSPGEAKLRFHGVAAACCLLLLCSCNDKCCAHALLCMLQRHAAAHAAAMLCVHIPVPWFCSQGRRQGAAAAKEPAAGCAAGGGPPWRPRLSRRSSGRAAGLQGGPGAGGPTRGEQAAPDPGAARPGQRWPGPAGFAERRRLAAGRARHAGVTAAQPAAPLCCCCRRHGCGAAGPAFAAAPAGQVSRHQREVG